MASFLFKAACLASAASAHLVHWPSHGPGNHSEVYPDLLSVTLDQLTIGLASSQYTSADLVAAYLARIYDVNSTLHCVTEVNPDAASIAAQLDAERKAGKVRGPLHGVPILIKNNIATDDKMNNTAGSYSLLGAKVPTDSTVAKKLRAAGAILLGKTNLSQWANFRSANTSNGWSAYGGQVYAAYYPNQDPSGSSSGSGVSSALGLALGTLGSETDGSIVSPAENNNLVGIKPTVGLTSRHLVIPISEHQDTVGPMTRTVKDAAHILQAIAGFDPLDNYTSAIPNNHVLPDYAAACKLTALKGARIGIPSNVISLFTASDNSTKPILDAFTAAIKTLQSAGAQMIPNTNFTNATQFLKSSAETTVLEADFIVNLHQYLELLTYNPTNITTLAQELNFTQNYPLEDYPQRDTKLWSEALAGFNNTDPRFWPVYQENVFYGSEGGLLGALARNNLDAIILPTAFSSSFAAGVGAPIVTVPMGAYPAGTPVVTNSWGLVQQAPNIPFGLAFLGAKFTEEKLIGYAYAYEQRSEVRNTIQPYVAPTTQLIDVVAEAKPNHARPSGKPGGRPSGKPSRPW